MSRHPPEALSRWYDRSSLTDEESLRDAQLIEMYGFAFPTELFEVWRWYRGLSADHRLVFTEILGMSLVGPFDVLAGSFDGFEPEYPMALHWRYCYDPPELFTVLSGNSDGLHWGYWFDDHARLLPVVVGYYARDSFDPTIYADTLVGTILGEIESCRLSILEDLSSDSDDSETYADDLEQLSALAATLPQPAVSVPRPRALAVEAGPGLIEPAIGGQAARALLLEGILQWLEDRQAAGRLLAEGYRLADRPILAATVECHTTFPVLPRVSLLDYPKGTKADLS